MSYRPLARDSSVGYRRAGKPLTLLALISGENQTGEQNADVAATTVPSQGGRPVISLGDANGNGRSGCQAYNFCCTRCKPGEACPRYLAVWKSSRRRVDGVEVDATTQPERAVKF